jgi:hypothetical protein
MSVESKVGRVSRDVSLAIADSACASVLPMLKNEMNLSNDQIMRIFSVMRSTIENTGINAVGQYVSLFNEISSDSSKKGKLFG